MQIEEIISIKKSSILANSETIISPYSNPQPLSFYELHTEKERKKNKKERYYIRVDNKMPFFICSIL